ncbi:MAG: S1/P1 nuclease [Rhodothermaceae bacterium]|nr:S1/P1 nuclease [Rhodothermaceae bacterium]
MTLFYRVVVLTLLLVSISASSSAAWSRTGHMVIAGIAFRSLSPDLQLQYTELLSHHPDYTSWKSDFDSLNVDIELGEYLFMRASYWPDVIRRQGSSEYDHPTWHYTNYPLTMAALTGADSTIGASLTPENDVRFGFDESLRVLFDESATMENRAAHLSWVIHLVGDVHQPMHAVASVSEMYPEGDRGGNLFFVRPTERSPGMNLHAYWDSLLGRSDDVRTARNETTRILALVSPDHKPAESDNTRVNDWALESRSYAIEYVYLRGELTATDSENRIRAAILPSDYAQNAKQVAEKRAVKSGFRLARVISEKG